MIDRQAIAQIGALLKQGKSIPEIAGTVGLEIGDVETVLAGAASSLVLGLEGEAGGSAVSASPGPSQSYTFTDEDVADPSSYWGAYPVKVLRTWTPTVSGKMTLQPPANTDDPNWSNYYTYIYEGATPNVSYPDTTADSGSFDYNAIPDSGYVAGDLNTPADLLYFSEMFVVAGVEYTVIIQDGSGTPGNTMNLDGLLSSLASFGGIDDAPFPPFPTSAPLVRLPDGTYRPRPEHPIGSPTLGRVRVSISHHPLHTFPDDIDPIAQVSSEDVIRGADGFRRIELTTLLGPGGHIGPKLSVGIDRFGMQISQWQFGVLKLDGSAWVVVTGGGLVAPGVDIPNPFEEYNVDSPLLDWSAPVISVGSDLVADPSSRLITSTAGGVVIAYTQFRVSPALL